MQSRDSLLEKLTTAQREAVTHKDGPLLVLAGPGSGKTRVITHRIAYLISQGIKPWHILAITFTNKAAQEMRQRVLAMGVAGGTTVCTFHALAARLLREFAAEAGITSTYSIFDEGDQKAAMREAISRLRLDSKNYPPTRLLGHISKYKNDLKTPEQAAQEKIGFMAEILAKVYKAYQEHLQANNALDFDDLLMRLAFLLRDKPALRQLLNERYRYVLVDEYQDTNHCQYQIARGLALSHGNLCVTGDPDQSIYSWRGADIGNILAFEEDYPHAKVVRLEENFRSVPEVLSLADELIRSNTQRKEKELFTSRPHGMKPMLREFYNEYEEAEGVCQWISEQRGKGVEYRHIAVFYRINSMSRVMEEALRKKSIPYQIVRGIEFFQRKEIKDMVAYLRFLVNPADQVSLARIINTPTRGIGKTTVERLLHYANSTGLDVGQALEQVERIEGLNAGAKSKVQAFVRLRQELCRALEGSVEDLMREVYEKSGLAEMLKKEGSEEPVENAEELINSAAEYDASAEKPSAAEYLQQIALYSDSDAYNAEAGCVSLMSLHAAKGLEFPAVAIIGVEEGLIPHTRSQNDKAGLEEERRLLFVGITRAQDRLLLTYADNRMVNGITQATIHSSFLRSLTHLDHQKASFADRKFDDEDEGFSDSPWKKKRPRQLDDDLADEIPSYDEEVLEFRKGQLVRHPKLGLGRIVELMPSRENSKVVVQFTAGGRKTLILKYAKLEPIDYPQ